jgi:hypothetical protein
MWPGVHFIKRTLAYQSISQLFFKERTRTLVPGSDCSRQVQLVKAHDKLSGTAELCALINCFFFFRGGGLMLDGQRGSILQGSPGDDTARHRQQEDNNERRMYTYAVF